MSIKRYLLNTWAATSSGSSILAGIKERIPRLDLALPDMGTSTHPYLATAYVGAGILTASIGYIVNTKMKEREIFDKYHNQIEQELLEYRLTV